MRRPGCFRTMVLVRSELPSKCFARRAHVTQTATATWSRRVALLRRLHELVPSEKQLIGFLVAASPPPFCCHEVIEHFSSAVGRFDCFFPPDRCIVLMHQLLYPFIPPPASIMCLDLLVEMVDVETTNSMMATVFLQLDVVLVAAVRCVLISLALWISDISSGSPCSDAERQRLFCSCWVAIAFIEASSTEHKEGFFRFAVQRVVRPTLLVLGNPLSLCSSISRLPEVPTCMTCLQHGHEVMGWTELCFRAIPLLPLSFSSPIRHALKAVVALFVSHAHAIIDEVSASVVNHYFLHVLMSLVDTILRQTPIQVYLSHGERDVWCTVPLLGELMVALGRQWAVSRASSQTRSAQRWTFSKVLRVSHHLTVLGASMGVKMGWGQSGLPERCGPLPSLWLISTQLMNLLVEVSLPREGEEDPLDELVEPRMWAALADVVEVARRCSAREFSSAAAYSPFLDRLLQWVSRWLAKHPSSPLQIEVWAGWLLCGCRWRTMAGSSWCHFNSFDAAFSDWVQHASTDDITCILVVTAVLQQCRSELPLLHADAPAGHLQQQLNRCYAHFVSWCYSTQQLYNSHEPSEAWRLTASPAAAMPALLMLSTRVSSVTSPFLLNAMPSNRTSFCWECAISCTDDSNNTPANARLWSTLYRLMGSSSENEVARFLEWRAAFVCDSARQSGWLSPSILHCAPAEVAQPLLLDVCGLLVAASPSGLGSTESRIATSAFVWQVAARLLPHAGDFQVMPPLIADATESVTRGGESLTSATIASSSLAFLVEFYRRHNRGSHSTSSQEVDPIVSSHWTCLCHLYEQLLVAMLAGDSPTVKTVTTEPVGMRVLDPAWICPSHRHFLKGCQGATGSKASRLYVELLCRASEATSMPGEVGKHLSAWLQRLSKERRVWLQQTDVPPTLRHHFSPLESWQLLSVLMGVPHATCSIVPTTLLLSLLSTAWELMDPDASEVGVLPSPSSEIIVRFLEWHTCLELRLWLERILLQVCTQAVDECSRNKTTAEGLEKAVVRLCCAASDLDETYPVSPNARPTSESDGAAYDPNVVLYFSILHGTQSLREARSLVFRQHGFDCGPEPRKESYVKVARQLAQRIIC